jgi:hypothetical protein
MKKLQVEKIQTEHRVENETDLQSSLFLHNHMARLGGLDPHPDQPIEIQITGIKLDSNGKPIITIETQ